MDWITLLGVFGLGSVVTAVVQWFIRRTEARNELQFREKREAYLGLLSAYRDVAQKNDHDSKMDYAYWRLRCQLVGSAEVNRKIEVFSQAQPSSREIQIAEEEMISEFRRDLGIS